MMYALDNEESSGYGNSLPVSCNMMMARQSFKLQNIAEGFSGSMSGKHSYFFLWVSFKNCWFCKDIHEKNFVNKVTLYGQMLVWLNSAIAINEDKLKIT